MSRQGFGRLNHQLDNQAGVDNVWEQEKLEARKILENAARAKRSPTRQVHALLGKPDERKTR